ncbi:uncharacterized protein LOC112048527 isoform X3 [Bicyclus anynana]|uniref:Uncharacterized protein LOC112048527 isoform X3 n=1 Tax=Bicyclus anynana TaxID=110368 RepID=A0A6J1NA17_BICAN|nr:uncharacterized protein LOC112048527 isoform X3 [Bicyclus anynana]
MLFHNYHFISFKPQTFQFKLQPQEVFDKGVKPSVAHSLSTVTTGKRKSPRAVENGNKRLSSRSQTCYEPTTQKSTLLWTLGVTSQDFGPPVIESVKTTYRENSNQGKIQVTVCANPPPQTAEWRMRNLRLNVPGRLDPLRVTPQVLLIITATLFVSACVLTICLTLKGLASEADSEENVEMAGLDRLPSLPVSGPEYLQERRVLETHM